MDALWAGGLYVNVHSNTYQGGEVRGQLMTDNITTVWAQMSGMNEVPAVDSMAMGRAALTVNNTTKAVVLHAMTSDLTDAIAAHIHQGFAGQNGDVVLGLEQDADDMAHWWAMGEFTLDQMDALWGGGFYVNVHSTSNASGEIRGQLIP